MTNITLSGNMIVKGSLVTLPGGAPETYWYATLGGVENDYGRFQIARDTGGNIYVIGYTGSDGAGGNDFLIAKYNSSGVIQWQRTLGGTGNDFGFGIAIDSTDNIYVAGFTDSDGEGGNDFLIAKYNSSGTIQWQRTLGGVDSDFGRGIAIDSTDNIYVVGYTDSDGAGDFDLLVAKYNAAGVIQWQRTLGGTGSDIGFGIAVDSTDNIYVVGYTDSDGAGGNDFLIAKYNSSGVIQWQRTLGGAGNDIGRGIAVDTSDNIYLQGSTDSSGEGLADLLLVKLPNDGSLTGVYGNLTYQASTLTDQVSTLTDQVSTLTDQASTLTDQASTLTDQTSTLISTVTPIE